MVGDDGFQFLQTENTNMGNKHIIKEATVVNVAPEKIIPNPYQPRRIFDEESLQELSASIAQYGVLQPLLVAPMTDGSEGYLLIAGERRLRASKMAGLALIPVIVSEYTEQQIAEIALIENLQREDLHFLEEADGYEKLMTQFKMTQESLAVRVGKKQSTIANKLRLLKLSTAVRGVIKDNELTERHSRALLKLDSEQEQLAVLKVVVQKQLNVRQTEVYIEKLLNIKPEADKKQRAIIVNDVRIYLNSIRKIVDTIKAAGIPVAIQQELDDEDVVVELRIKNCKKKR